MRLLDFVEALEETLGKQAIKNFLPMQPGDVPSTCADASALQAAVGFKPNTPVKEGIQRFVTWYRAYYQV